MRHRGLTPLRTLALAGMLTLAASAAGGPGWARGPWRADAANTPGWTLMDPDERVEHQRRLRGQRTLDDCRRVDAAHRGAMAERARRAGRTPDTPPEDACEQLRARGHLR
jgi:hypothetical protein